MPLIDYLRKVYETDHGLYAHLGREPSFQEPLRIRSGIGVAHGSLSAPRLKVSSELQVFSSKAGFFYFITALRSYRRCLSESASTLPEALTCCRDTSRVPISTEDCDIVIVLDASPRYKCVFLIGLYIIWRSRIPGTYNVIL